MDLLQTYLLENRHFREYTFSTENVTHIWIASLIFWITVSFLAVKACGENRRKLAWVISLVNSSTMMIVGIVYSFVKFSQYPNFFDFDPAAREMIHSVDNVTVIVCIWFALANVFDIVVGMLFYPQHLDPLTAYVHHTVALWITYASTTGDGLFSSIEPFASLFLVLMLVEIPTFLLALGAVFPSLRTDIGFGITFFIFRLLFLAAMIYYSVMHNTSTTIRVLGAGFMLLHTFWFSNWIKKYGKNLVGGKKSDKKDKESTDSKKHA
jgi:hypothetical protein